MKQQFKLIKYNYTKIFLLLLLLILSSSTLKAQFYSIGQDPASIKWKQIKTENFTILYPEGFDFHAMYLANVMQYVRTHGTASLGNPPKHVTVILHNRSSISNALSIWAPKRNEFFTCPPQDSYAQDWLEQLATHEYRHMTQMNMLNCGATKVLGWFFGQQINSVVLGLYVPSWFMEGDAVTTETLLTKSGRGRIPSFEMIVRAQVLGYKMFSFDKAVLGSYKDFVPDQYYFGYEMVAGARKKYGSEIWKSAMETTGKNPFIITPFNRGLKKVSGLNKTQLYKSVYNNLDSLWKIQRDQLTYTPFNSITPDKQKIYTNYQFPHFINDSIIVAEKSGIDDIERLVQINKNGKEKIIHTPGFYVYESLSVTKTMKPSNSADFNKYESLSLPKNYMTWAESKIDKRWALRDYSVIMLYNFETGKTKQITKKSRYFAPNLFPDAKKIVAVEVTNNNVCSLVILNSQTGKVINKIEAGGNNLFQTPTVSDDGKRIVVVLFDHNNGKSIISVNPETGQRKTMLNPTFDEISKPIFYKKYLFFNGIYSGIDNIYALDTSNGKIWQVTSALYGTTDLNISPDGKKIIYSNYTPTGYQIAEAVFDSSKWKPIEQVANNSVQLYKSLLSQESGLVDSVNIPQKNYEIKNYHKWQHLFNPHSWAPAFIDAGNMTLHPGVSIQSQNMLSTTFATLGYNFNLNENTGQYYANVSYQDLYPIFNLTYSSGNNAIYSYKNSGDTVKAQRIVYHSSDVQLGISIPFSFTKGDFVQQILPSASIEHFISSGISDSLIPDKFTVMDYSLSASNQIKSVLRDMLPRWEQSLFLEYKNTPFNGSKLGTIFSSELTLLFPGLGKHHSLMITSGYQKKTTNHFAFTDLLIYPRGYNRTNEFSGKLFNNNLESLSLNYKFPFLYPDLKIGSLLYIQRLKANYFYDYAIGKTNFITTQYRSTGVELTSDMNVARFLFPIDTGIRASYIPDLKITIFEFLIQMNFSRF